MQPRYFALTAGIIYLVVGIVGLVPGLHSAAPASDPHVDITSDYGYLLGLFPVNLLHDLVHILIGIGGIVAGSQLSRSLTFARLLFIVYGLLAIMGFIPTLQTTFGLIPIFGNDIWLHAATALVAAYFGWVATAETNLPVEAH